tara:strand:- start:338 stop:496 length:159 start_codon:yes stop_codon:yes gene_type:complete
LTTIKSSFSPNTASFDKDDEEEEEDEEEDDEEEEDEDVACSFVTKTTSLSLS